MFFYCKHRRFKEKNSKYIQNFIIITIIFGIWFSGSVIIIEIDNQYHTNNPKNYNEVQSEFENLSTHIDNYCRTLQRKSFLALPPLMSSKEESMMALLEAQKEKLMRDNLIYFPELNQMWCLVPKAASTSWSHTIVDVLNSKHMNIYIDNDDTQPTPIQVVLKENYGTINKSTYMTALRSSKIQKILLIRHPFSRLVSVYENKLQDRKARSDGMFFFQRYGVKINRNYRQNKKNKKKEPTFEEFIQYIIETDPMSFDDHWKPISLLCGMCQVKYDDIIKVEDLDKSLPYHMKKLGFERHSLAHKNPTYDIKGHYKNISSYYANISKTKMFKLFQKYEDDFRLFQYNFQDYL